MTAKPMTLRQFFERLPRDGWYVKNGAIRRGEWRTDDCQCPLTSVSGDYIIDDYEKAAASLGIDANLASAIATSADCNRGSPTERRIRRLLLRHCNLTEPTT